MTVKELIDILKEFDQDCEVIVCDEVDGNSSPLVSVEDSKYRKCDVALLRW